MNWKLLTKFGMFHDQKSFLLQLGHVTQTTQVSDEAFDNLDACT